ncbi:hypothetical protein [Rhizobium leguminosarum]|nr:hypothetical protein [Rhizobium leguminosarum]
MNITTASIDALFAITDRKRTARELRRLADLVADELASKLGGQPAYVVGSGPDLDQFGARVADKLGKQLLGAAAIWTHLLPHRVAGNIRNFCISQEIIEPLPPKSTVVLCQSVIADEFEVQTIISRLQMEQRIDRLIICAAALATELRARLTKYFRYDGLEVEFVAVLDFATETELLRDHIYSVLDDRPMKIVPIMSRWMMERTFGPKPSYDDKPRPKPRPRRPGPNG